MKCKEFMTFHTTCWHNSTWHCMSCDKKDELNLLVQESSRIYIFLLFLVKRGRSKCCKIHIFHWNGCFFFSFWVCKIYNFSLKINIFRPKSSKICHFSAKISLFRAFLGHFGTFLAYFRPILRTIVADPCEIGPSCVYNSFLYTYTDAAGFFLIGA